ncbi:hypothetical protein FACS1894111_12580 [Clostridia bacterium]|nr:hypothetical protein FACS1894111_12580 [Clostridia bacterium]
MTIYQQENKIKTVNSAAKKQANINAILSEHVECMILLLRVEEISL